MAAVLWSLRVDGETADAVERVRQRTGEDRSSFIRRALRSAAGIGNGETVPKARRGILARFRLRKPRRLDDRGISPWMIVAILGVAAAVVIAVLLSLGLLNVSVGSCQAHGTVSESVTGNPLVGALVQLRKIPLRGETFEVVDSDTAGLGGAYSVGTTCGGQYVLVASMSGYKAKYTDLFFNVPQNVQVVNFGLAPVDQP